MSYKEYAAYLGISVHTLYGWIKYKRVPDLPMAYTMAVTLGVTLNYLFGGKETNITQARLKELEARKTAAEALKLAKLMIKEMEKLRPL